MADKVEQTARVVDTIQLADFGKKFYERIKHNHDNDILIEKAARIAGDKALQLDIDNKIAIESQARIKADTQLSQRINEKIPLIPSPVPGAIPVITEEGALQSSNINLAQMKATVDYLASDEYMRDHQADWDVEDPTKPGFIKHKPRPITDLAINDICDK